MSTPLSLYAFDGDNHSEEVAMFSLELLSVWCDSRDCHMRFTASNSPLPEAQQ
jgi:hypothetical protein